MKKKLKDVCTIEKGKQIDTKSLDDSNSYRYINGGYSLDQKRDVIEANDIPDIISRWNNLAGEADRTHYEKSFLVDKQEIVDNDYVFSFNKYQKKQVEKKEYRPVKEIFASINELEKQFSQIMKDLQEE